MKLPSLVVTGILLSAMSSGWCADVPPAVPADVPAALQVPAGSVLQVAANAIGVQIYECIADKNNTSQYSWQLKAPDAGLVSRDGAIVIRHYGGPTWEAPDGSKIIGKLKASDPGPDSSGIAWLLLDAQPGGRTGLFSKISYVQRIHTAGGKAPADGCDQAHAGSELRVPYSAQYFFYSGK